MRQLKFRCWDKETKRMTEPFGFNETPTVVNDSSGYLVEINDENIMQFTGLFDSKGVEIYEGDILEADDDGWKKRGEVEFMSGCFRAVAITMCECIGEEIDLGHTYTIIGNMYQNQELLHA